MKQWAVIDALSHPACGWSFRSSGAPGPEISVPDLVVSRLEPAYLCGNATVP